MLGTRYRIIETSSDVVTSNHMQYARADSRARESRPEKALYRERRVSTREARSSVVGQPGPGTGDFNGHDHYMRQLYVRPAPAAGVEGQFGGLYVTRGENTEYTSYDDDGYLVGGRASVRRPKALYFDEMP